MFFYQSKHGCFQARKAEIEILRVQHRTRKHIGRGVACFRQTGNRWPAGVAKAEKFGGFIKRFAGGIIQRFAEQRILPDTFNPHQLRVTTRHQQRNKGKHRWSFR